MRIIGGALKGRKLFAPRGATTRPTANRIREALFSIIGPAVGDAAVLDLFAGSGALALEALSRGARTAVLVESDGKALETMRRNVQRLGLEGRVRLIRWNAARSLDCVRGLRPPFDLVFIDPPYGRGFLAPAMANLTAAVALAPGALVVVEHAISDPVPPTTAGLALEDQRRYGKTLVSFFEPVL
jgi:16S rRNA (guanine966-N2)-methyltransferase